MLSFEALPRILRRNDEVVPRDLPRAPQLALPPNAAPGLPVHAGLGWVAVGVDGTASLRVWAPPGVAITTRGALVPDLAKELQRPGFDKLAVQAVASVADQVRVEESPAIIVAGAAVKVNTGAGGGIKEKETAMVWFA